MKVTSSASALAILVAMSAAQATYAQQRSQDVESRDGRCQYAKNGTRFDTCECGAIADGFANRILEGSDARLIVVDGYAGRDKAKGIEVRRAANAQHYLTEFKGIDPARIVLRWARIASSDCIQESGGLRITLLDAGEPLPALIMLPIK